MARIIPNNTSPDDFHGSVGEAKVYQALKSLPDEYIVFHSVRWHKKDRIGNVVWGESDFTVFNPKRGIIVIEVKSGGIRHDDNGWTQVNTLNGYEYSMKDPLAQAERSKYTFLDMLESVFGGRQLYWIETAVWFPSIESVKSIGVMPPSYSPEIVLTEKDLISPKQSIERIFNYYRIYEKQVITSSDKDLVVRTLSPSFDAIPSMTTRINEEEYAFNRMTNEQSYLLDYLEEQNIAAIQGGAGTGKTMLAIEKAKRLSINNKVLFLCFNKFLLRFLKDNYGNDYPNIDFFNLPSLVCHNTGLHDAGGNEGISNYLFSIEKDNWPYTHIIIDEGQDFFEDHLVLLSLIAKQANGCFYVFYDKNQLVQQRQSLDWVKSVECRLVLSTNCRNTKSIAITSNKPLGIENVKMRVDVLGDKPNLYIVNDKSAVLDVLAKIIRKYTDSGIKKRDITILTVKTEETSILTGVSSIGPYHLFSDMVSQGILFTSARKFKGLESPIVIIVDLDEKSFETEEAKRVLYVGASRAKHCLDIVAMLNDEQLSQIVINFQGKDIKNSKVAIGSYLKVKMATI